MTLTQAAGLRTQHQGSLVFRFHLPRSHKPHNHLARPKNLCDANEQLLLIRDSKAFTAYLEFSINPKFWKFVIICGLLDPTSIKDNLEVIAHPDRRPDASIITQGDLIPWGTILTDQDPLNAPKLKTINKLFRSGEESGLVGMRGTVLSWYTRDRKLHVDEMANETKVASGDDAEMRYYLGIIPEFRKGIAVFRVGVYVEKSASVDGTAYPNYCRPEYDDNPPPFVPAPPPDRREYEYDELAGSHRNGGPNQSRPVFVPNPHGGRPTPPRVPRPRGYPFAPEEAPSTSPNPFRPQPNPPYVPGFGPYQQPFSPGPRPGPSHRSGIGPYPNAGRMPYRIPPHYPGHRGNPTGGGGNYPHL
ncbi:hypothetical protein F5Y19DRAFT_488004 [Xylariaceae sp. FL1651]|nr:hypothetical protein F5Y19DRAFT_488004 [Xylariaceae sp. FL1651]